MTRTIKVCPDCDSSNIRKQTGRWGGKNRYYCNGCNQPVEKPKVREPLSQGTRSGLSKQLADMDADDVGGPA